MKIPKRQIEELTRMSSELERQPQLDVALENFGRYAEDLKAYLLKHIEAPDLRLQIVSIPELNYERARSTIGSYFIKALSRRKARGEKDALEQARAIASQFNTVLLELLMRAD
ncbi:MAG: hypothetical protein KTR30_14750 [Saprospiraceae bacterium]|nr:hypothetical protein [Saprospiraceae bacterium]